MLTLEQKIIKGKMNGKLIYGRLWRGFALQDGCSEITYIGLINKTDPDPEEQAVVWCGDIMNDRAYRYTDPPERVGLDKALDKIRIFDVQDAKEVIPGAMVGEILLACEENDIDWFEYPCCACGRMLKPGDSAHYFASGYHSEGGISYIPGEPVCEDCHSNGICSNCGEEVQQEDKHGDDCQFCCPSPTDEEKQDLLVAIKEKLGDGYDDLLLHEKSKRFYDAVVFSVKEFDRPKICWGQLDPQVVFDVLFDPRQKDVDGQMKMKFMQKKGTKNEDYSKKRERRGKHNRNHQCS